jgi:TonB family protein
MGQRPFTFPTRIRCGSDHHDYQALYDPDPAYPAEAVAEGIEGEVVLDLVVGHEGELLELKVESGDPLLADAALGAVRQWKYKGTKLNGRPVEVKTDVHMKFRLTDQSVRH